MVRLIALRWWVKNPDARIDLLITDVGCQAA